MCSVTYPLNRDTVFKKKGKSAHIQTTKHQVALNAQSPQQEIENPESIPGQSCLEAAEPARLTLAMRFMMEKGDSSDNENMNMAPSMEGPFDSVMEYGNGEFYDASGQQIIFGAGDNTGSSDSQQILRSQIEALDMYDHQILGKISTSVEDMFSDCMDDATVNNLIAAMDALGMLNIKARWIRI